MFLENYFFGFSFEDVYGSLFCWFVVLLICFIPLIELVEMEDWWFVKLLRCENMRDDDLVIVIVGVIVIVIPVSWSFCNPRNTWRSRGPICRWFSWACRCISTRGGIFYRRAGARGRVVLPARWCCALAVQVPLWLVFLCAVLRPSVCLCVSFVLIPVGKQNGRNRSSAYLKPKARQSPYKQINNKQLTP